MISTNSSSKIMFLCAVRTNFIMKSYIQSRSIYYLVIPLSGTCTMIRYLAIYTQDLCTNNVGITILTSVIIILSHFKACTHCSY